jgi:hypothetical protein
MDCLHSLIMNASEALPIVSIPSHNEAILVPKVTHEDCGCAAKNCVGWVAGFASYGGDGVSGWTVVAGPGGM